MPEFGETGKGFKMKGWSPFTKRTDPPQNNKTVPSIPTKGGAEDAYESDDVYKARIARLKEQMKDASPEKKKDIQEQINKIKDDLYRDDTRG